jgi:phosphatidylserine decarboxylase
LGHTGIIALEGLHVVAVLAVAAVVLWAVGWYKAAALVTALCIFSLWFFRNPGRVSPSGEGLVVAPADGRVVFVGEVEEPRLLKARALKVSIFMSVFDVHVNRAPETGRVSGIHYNKGKFVSANLDKASLDNEQNAVIVEDEHGRRLCFVQIAGFLARRIVCHLETGMSVARGQRYGMIKFGSRVDIYLPAAARVCVTVGDRTYGARTVVGEWS